VGGAVALVHIQVNHRHLELVAALAPGFGLHQAGGDRDVVEHAKTAPLVGVGMVRATGQVASDALPQGSTGSRHRGSDRAPRPLGHGRAPGKTDLPVKSGIQGALRDALDVGRGVHQRQLAIAGGWGLRQRDARQLGHQPVTQAAVLVHRKAVAFGQRQDKVVGVEGVHQSRFR